MSEPDSKSSGDKQVFTRRDFLKLSGLGLGALALRKLTKEKKNENIFKIETPDAYFYPIYENHTKPISKEELSKYPPLDIYFYELAGGQEYLEAFSPTAFFSMSGSSR